MNDENTSVNNNISETINDIQNEIKTLQQDKLILNTVKNNLTNYIKELDAKIYNN